MNLSRIRELIRGGCADPYFWSCYHKKDQSAPDYTPLANASADSNKIMAELGQKQLDFAKQQYEDSLPMYKDLVAQQLQIGDSSLAQGNDYYDYMVSQQRPVEEALNKEAMAAGSQDQQDAAAAQAVADARTGYTGALNTAARQGARYGWDASKIAAEASKSGLGYASATAGAANAAREKEKQIGYAKKLDVAGLYRGLPGASQGAYGMAINAGNSAAANNAAPGAQYQAGLAAGANTIGQGRQLYQSGLQGVLNTQAGMANANASANGQAMAGLGSAAGAGIGLYAAVAI
ncbi:MAG: hypothetical protein ABFC67_14595 [Mizugakiibacter sp.]|uniref:hypothetical protein n=1 Tax=Mizugakiibacter sp. TaxID=1972610 RepID=UPI00320FB0EF